MPYLGFNGVPRDATRMCPWRQSGTCISDKYSCALSGATGLHGASEELERTIAAAIDQHNKAPRPCTSGAQRLNTFSRCQARKTG